MLMTTTTTLYRLSYLVAYTNYSGTWNAGERETADTTSDQSDYIVIGI